MCLNKGEPLIKKAFQITFILLGRTPMSEDTAEYNILVISLKTILILIFSQFWKHLCIEIGWNNQLNRKNEEILNYHSKLSVSKSSVTLCHSLKQLFLARETMRRENFPYVPLWRVLSQSNSPIRCCCLNWPICVRWPQ